MQKKLAQLNFDFSQFTIDEFTKSVESHLGRKIIFISWPMPTGLFGAWVAIKDRPHDYVFYDENSPPLLEVHTKLHELGHIINGHETLELSLIELKELLHQDGLNSIFQECLLRGDRNPTLRILKREMQINLEKNSSEDSSHTLDIERKMLMERQAEVIAELVQEQAIQHARLEYLTNAVSDHENAAIYLKGLGLG